MVMRRRWGRIPRRRFRSRPLSAVRFLPELVLLCCAVRSRVICFPFSQSPLKILFHSSANFSHGIVSMQIFPSCWMTVIFLSWAATSNLLDSCNSHLNHFMFELECSLHSFRGLEENPDVTAPSYHFPQLSSFLIQDRLNRAKPGSQQRKPDVLFQKTNLMK